MSTNELSPQQDGRRSPPKRPPMEPPTLVRAEEVARLLNVGGRTFWRWVAAGTFPPPDLREGRVVRWKRETVGDWLAHRCSGTDGKNGK